MIRKVVTAATVAMAVVALAAAPSLAQYANPDPTLDVEPSEIPQGCGFVLSGANLQPNTEYKIGILPGTGDVTRRLPDTREFGEVTTGPGGSFAQVLTIAADLDPGFYGVAIDTEFTVVAQSDTETVYSNVANVTIEVVPATTCPAIPVEAPGVITTPTDTTTPATGVPADTGVPANTNGNAGGPGNVGAGNDGVNSGTLARTGSDTVPLVAGGLSLVAAGGAVLLYKRRSIA